MIILLTFARVSRTDCCVCKQCTILHLTLRTEGGAPARMFFSQSCFIYFLGIPVLEIEFACQGFTALGTRLIPHRTWIKMF